MRHKNCKRIVMEQWRENVRVAVTWSLSSSVLSTSNRKTILCLGMEWIIRWRVLQSDCWLQVAGIEVGGKGKFGHAFERSYAPTDVGGYFIVVADVSPR